LPSQSFELEIISTKEHDVGISLDPQIAAFIAQYPEPPLPEGVDALALRAVIDPLMAETEEAMPDAPSVRSRDYWVDRDGRRKILSRWYTKSSPTPGSAVVYFHGGGMISGSVDLYERTVSTYVEVTGVPFLSVDYGLAPEFTGTTPVEDGLAAVCWLLEQATHLGIDRDRVAVMGDSAGGGVAAGVAIAARDAGVPLAKQILIYPMLDDRTVHPDPAIGDSPSWTHNHNLTGWQALLGDSRGTGAVSPLAAPARLKDFAGLAPTFIDVGDLDLFREENVLYSLNLMRAGVATELYVRTGCPHGFDRYSLEIAVANASWQDRFRAIKGL
jgi:acetyl esterase/lipase